MSSERPRAGRWGYGAPKVLAHPQRWRQGEWEFKVILDYRGSKVILKYMGLGKKKKPSIIT